MGIAWVFPGQGSQAIGMAEAVLELPGARERFARASDLLGRDLLAICAGEGLEAAGSPSDLNDTRNTQPALFVIESLLVDALKAQGRSAELVAEMMVLVEKMANHFAKPGTAYPALPWPAYGPHFNDYAHLERVAEWSTAGGGEE